MGAPLRLLLLALTVATVGSQLRTVVRSGTAGLSTSTWLAMLSSTTVWLGYGLLTREPTLIGINVVVLLSELALVAVFLRDRAVRPSGLVPYVTAPVALVGLAVLVQQPWLLGAGGTLLAVGRLVPQVVVIARAVDRTGVSTGSWVANGTSNVVWGGYGFTIGDAFVAWPGVAAAVVSFLVVALATRRPRHGGGVVVAVS